MVVPAERPRPDKAFVGRLQELKQLQSAFDVAASGQGSLVMLAGEPGIGKTALCLHAARYARSRGGRVLLGHCYEEISLPYLAFVEALRESLLEGETVLRDFSGATYLIRLVPELRERLQVEPSPAADPEEERWWMLEAVADCLRRISEQAPLLLIVEDLHWADRGTLNLLVHCARRLKDARVLILGTYRDAELDEVEALSSALADLRREADLLSINLRGLAPEEVHGLCVALVGPGTTPERTAAVYRRTEGNPLFVHEVLREQGQSASAQGVPGGLRDMLRKRLGRLSEACGGVLITSAVLGREFQFDVLKRVGGLEDGSLVAALEEAMGAGVIEEIARPGSIRYRFTHALFRQTVYEQASVARRRGLHRQAGLVLEELYAGHTERYAAELMEHFGSSTDASDLGRAIEYGRIAGRQAMEVFAYGEAARLFERAVEAQMAFDQSHKESLCDLMLAQGEALTAAGERDRVIHEVAPRALALAEALNDHWRALAACRIALDATTGRPSEAWLEVAERYAGDDSEARISVNTHRSALAVHAGRWTAARQLLLEAMDLARRAGLPYQQAQATSFLLRIGLATDAEERQLFAEIRGLQSASGSIRSEAAARFDAVMTFLQWGQRREAEDERAELVSLAARTRHSSAAAHLALTDTLFAMLDGRLAEAVELSEQMQSMGTFPKVWRGHLAAWLGDEARLEELLASSREIRGRSVFGPATGALFLGYLGRSDEARFEVRAVADYLRSPSGDLISFVLLAHLASHASLNEDRPAADAILERLRGETRLLAKPVFILLPRHLGRAAGLLGRFDEAKAHFETAIEFCEGIRYRPEQALTRLDLARLLLQRYPRERGQVHALLERAAQEAEAMGMHPALEEALALRDGLAPEPASRPALPDGLSAREAEVLRLLAAGRSNQQIADELVISLNTVRRHVSNTFGKTGAANRVEAASYARDHGLA